MKNINLMSKKISIKSDSKIFKDIYLGIFEHPDFAKIVRIFKKANDKRKLDRLARLINYKVDKQIRLSWNFFTKCRYCNKTCEDDISITKSYWGSLWSRCHESCRKKGEKEEAYECQKIDADCNDCHYFVRKKRRVGKCSHLDKKVLAEPQFASGYNCFVHRKDGPI